MMVGDCVIDGCQLDRLIAERAWLIKRIEEIENRYFETEEAV